ncbi:MAG: hypothetical protein KBG15_03950 [Kofleriaceae bacterium]|nr:hypothetical protein [Kofleriaceae bacterium]
MAILITVTAALVGVIVAALARWRWRWRRRQPTWVAPLPRTRQVPAAPLVARSLAALPVSQPRRRQAGPRTSTAMNVVADTDILTCPTCLREFHGQRFCTSDARRLAAAHEVRTRGRGVSCLGCHRAFDAGVSQCPHDSLPLVPHSLHGAASAGRRPRGLTQPAHVLARICPLCGIRDDLHARFCGRDGAALLVIN